MTEDRRVVRAAVAATVLLGLLAVLVASRRDPSLLGTGLWAASMGGALVAATLHDRGARVVGRLRDATSWRRFDTIAVIAVSVLALVVRMHRLGLRLPAPHGDEGEMAVLARQALQGTSAAAGPLPVFATGFLDHPTAFHHLQAAALSLLGDSLTSLRILSAVSGALGVTAVFVLTRLAWGRAAGLSAGVLAAASAIHVQYSRIALNNIESATAATVVMALLVAAVVLQRGSDSEVRGPSSTVLFVWLGLATGVAQYLYYGSRLLLVAVPLVLVVLWRRAFVDRMGLVAAGGSMTIAVLPLARHYLEYPITFSNRSRGVSVFAEGGLRHELGPDATLPAQLSPLLWQQIRRNVSFFTGAADRSTFFSEGFSFDRATIVLFWIGFVVLLWSAVTTPTERSTTAWVVLVWLIAGVALGGIATIDSPNGPRLLMIVPSVFVIGGVGARTVWRACCRWCPRRPAVARGVAVTAALWVCFANWNRYFVDQAAESRRSPLVDIALLFRDRAETDHVFLIGGDVLRAGHGVIRFVAPDTDAEDLATALDLESRFGELADDDRNVLVVLVPAFATELETLQRNHPDGRTTVVTGPRDEPWFTTFELPR